MTLVQDSGQLETIEFIVSEELHDMRLDMALAKYDLKISRSRAQNLIEKGFVKVNGDAQLSKKYTVKKDDSISITIPAQVELKVEAENIPLDVVYEDDDLIVINKPKDMVVHPAPGNTNGTLVNGLLYHCKDSLSGVNGVIRPGIVHRIDKDTSGLLVVAKNDEAHKGLSEQLTDHSMEREYEAIVYNNIKEDTGSVDAPIGRDPKNRLRNKVVNNGRHAVTHFEVIERFGKYTHIKLRLETGRTHQIRVHMAHIGHPLLGDKLYCNAKNSLGANTQVLHAGKLGFVHPSTGELMRFEAPLPDDFVNVLKKLRKTV